MKCSRDVARALLAALALSAAAGSEGALAGEGARGDDSDDESDSAPFTVVVEHGGGAWRCGAALVSLRTALTSARCARGPRAAGGEVWARAQRAASRVLRVAVAADAADADEEAAWSAGAAARDVALLELAEALAGARPILLAVSGAECAAPRDCYLVRALGAGATRLRIVELALRPARECWQRAAPDDERALCLTGPPLCQSERGAGVVCGGKLCGVLSASRERGQGEGCGAPHAGASAPRWRRFLHCAHTRGACGRDGECARLCTERWLLEEPPSGPLTAPLAAPLDALFASLVPTAGAELASEWPARTYPAPALAPTPTSTLTLTLTLAVSDADDSLAPDTPPPTPPSSSPSPAPQRPTRSPPATPSPPADPAPPSVTARHAHEFEPNRADFTAGEYGDNAAEYLAPADEPPPAAPAPASAEPPRAIPAAPAGEPAPPAPPAPRAVLARVSSEAWRSAAAAPPPPLTSLLCLTSYIYVIIVK